MTSLLLVDDDNSFIESVRDGLLALLKDFQVEIAANGLHAVDVLQHHPIDLVITDVKMPEMDGFELMAFMSREFPAIPIIVITAYGSLEVERRLEQFGSFQYLEKPLDLEILVKKINAGLEARSDGFLTGIALPSFVQLVAWEGKTCTIKIKSGPKTGVLYFSRGTLMDAETGVKTGNLAALEIFSWDAAELSIENKCEKKANKIDHPLDFLILESYRQKDEGGVSSRTQEEPAFEAEDLNIEFMPEMEARFPLDTLLEFENEVPQKPQEVKMDVSKLNEAIETLRKDLGDGLLATDIFSAADGQSIIGYNTNNAACALFNQVTDHLNKVMKSSGFPEIGKYYFIDLADDKIVLNIPLGDYQWLMLLEGSQVKLGLLLNVVIPRILDVFEESLAG